MTRTPSLWLATSALALGALLCGPASAQSTWNLVAGAGCSQGGTNSGNFGNSYSCTGTGTGGTAATAYAYSTQNNVTGNANFQNTTAAQYANAHMSAQGTSGFGVANRTEGLGVAAPDHAIDNNPTGSYDMIVLNFAQSVVLNQIGIGWANTGAADVSVLRWTGAGAPTGTAAVSTGGNSALLRAGWTLVNSLSDVIGDNVAPYGTNARNTGATATQGSSWWMISAFNTTLNTSNHCLANNSGGTVAENLNGKCDDGDDAFKLNFLRTTLTATPPAGVPEPGTAALVGLALLGGFAARRRAQAAARR